MAACCSHDRDRESADLRESGMDETLAPTSDLNEVEARLAMPLAQAMFTQRAVRRVHPDPVDDRVVLRCLELALQAPNASNAQNWQFVVVKDPAVKAALAAQYRRVWALYRSLGWWVRVGEETARIISSAQWQVEHFEQIPVLVVCCLRDATRGTFRPQTADCRI